MQLLDNKIKQYIKQAINDITSQSSGEIVCVIANSSSNYRVYPLFLAGIISLLIVPELDLASLLGAPSYTIASLVNYLAIIISFLMLTLLFIYTPCNIWLTPKTVKKACARRFALEQFYAHNLHTTPQHSGILIFISVAEKYVEIISDKGINQVIEKNTWDSILDNLIKAIKQNKLGEGLLYNIPQLKNILVRHFPIKEKTKEPVHTVIEIYSTDYID